MSIGPSQSGAPPQIGPYLCRGLLALGGESAVWTSETAQGWLAINIARRPEASDALERSAEFLRQNPHPHLPRLLDAGIYASSLSWFATDFVEGRSLDQWVAGRNPTWPARIGVALELVDVLAHLHRHGRVHGDLKPGNVIVDENDHITLFDLGGGEAGTVQVTPGFAAPELLAGAAPTVKSDVWALGASLHAAFAGEPSLDTHDPVALMGRTGRLVPLPLSAWCCDVPEDLDALLLEMQRTDPRGRPSLDAVGQRLAAMLDREPRRAPFAQRATRVALRLALAEAQAGPLSVNLYGAFGSGRKALIEDLRVAVRHDPCATEVQSVLEANALLSRQSRKIPVWITDDPQQAEQRAEAWRASGTASLVVVWSTWPVTLPGNHRSLAVEPWTSADVATLARALNRRTPRPWETAQSCLGLPRRILKALDLPLEASRLPADAQRVLDELRGRPGWTPTTTLQRALDLGNVALIDALETLVAEGLATFGPWSRSAAAVDTPDA